MSPIRWILVLAALLRLGSILILRNFLHPEIWEFGPIARNINSGLGYSIQLPNGVRAYIGIHASNLPLPSFFFFF